MRAASAQDLVFTLFGDYLLARRQPIAVGQLIELLKCLGVEAPAVRTALSRMCSRGWLCRRRRSGYELSDRGRTMLEEGRRRIYEPPTAQTWDGRWLLVTYSVPETQRRIRDRLRARLAWLGFGAVAGGSWVSPHDHAERVLAIARELGVDQIEVFRGEHLGPGSSAELVRSCWDLDLVNEAYRRFLARWEPQLEHCGTCRAAGRNAAVGLDGRPCLQPQDCFVRRFELVHEFRRFPAIDPFLPAELLPESWLGAAAARVFDTCHRILSPSAEAFVAATCAAASGSGGSDRAMTSSVTVPL
jgi:phenylacetic acid degradation operon negative regulatory protein